MPMIQTLRAHWQLQPPASRQRLLGGALLAAVLSLLLLGKPLLGHWLAWREAAQAWPALWREAQRLTPSRALSAQAWQDAEPALRLEASQDEAGLWRIVGKAKDAAALQRLQSWAQARGWWLQSAQVNAEDAGLTFNLAFVAALGAGA